jgi:C-terminal processing protease CtpA/Prc
MFREVKEKNIQNVAVDLRDNGGGNSLVVNEFIRYLNIESFEQGTNDWRWGCFMIPFHQSTVKNKKYEELLFEGEVYILTSSSSFSSAMLFAQWIVDNNLGTLIGEAPGNDPNGYGDVTMFTLPNSKLFLQTSTKVFCRADKDNPDDLVEPDISCDANEAMEVLFEEISK